MKILVTVHGKERSFTSKELTEALERLADFEQDSKLAVTLKGSQPMVDKWFTIMPQDIDWEKVKRDCKDASANGLWEHILWAKEQIPTDSKYQGKIETFVPKKTWEKQTEKQRREMAKELGDEMVDEVIIYLELAQRIDNGETVETLTQKSDHLAFSRQIITKDGGTGYVGGASDDIVKRSPSDISRYSYAPNCEGIYTVPAVARFSK